MLVSYKWLQDFLDLDVEPHELAEKITRTGIEIASVEHPMDGLKKIVVGHVLECEMAPDSDHLHITKVDVGEAEPLQIVCGAPNVAAGQYVIVALHGARIADNVKIKRGKLRGIESDGMICGLQEIGFPDKLVPAEFADGIFVFPEAITPGTDVYEALGMDDYILDFDITPNRADTLSMEGAAYEVGAIIDQKPKIEDVVLKGDAPDWTNELSIKVDSKLAPKFLMRKVSGVKIGPSPLWMQVRLWNAGIRPINNVVDATNYCMLLTGQPMHAYDAAAFATGKCEVRLANEGEKLTLLDESEIDLNAEDIVITDGEKPVALAGVMGGLNSEVTDKTTDVILESAVFDPALVRKAALRHDARSEASARFEKGINWDNTEKALNMASLILRNHAAGNVHEGINVGSNEKRQKCEITVPFAHFNKVLGTNLSDEEILKIFAKLNFATSVSGEEVTVTVPNRRWDIFIDADLVEEVGRIYGYDNIKSTQPVLGQTHGGYNADEVKVRHLRNLVQGQGLVETINYSLTSADKAVLFEEKPLKPVNVEWPLNSARTTMRQNLMASLVETASYNFARKQNEVRIFEQGRVYDLEGDSYNEHSHLAALYTGNVEQTNWQHTDEKIDFYYVKGQVESLFDAVIKQKVTIEYKAIKLPGMHPTRTAGIYLDGQYVGFVGQISSLHELFDKNLRGKELYGYELNLDLLLPLMEGETKSQPAPKFPAVERDLSLLVDKKVTNTEVSDVIKASAGKYLYKLAVIDVYQGAHIEPGKKSLAYKLTFLNEKDTLTDEVVSKAINDVTTALTEKLEIEVR
ncbi:phenylalanine--tRNA ligase subunit beta [Lactobacillus psittaci]|uniref:Phenylalanine--tRNA ligase beta subunit n=1 Tax=Lactobacillus psittaci DSM 15354 TaxID=1122152 RepID=A0A0R1S436_9LACO|nr:phenylalanine--tRNA ligase subunit beta [Lactobacillus psittaci]KRL63401.1 phenylalanyl-tRNA synthetase, beta subunit [Lactobacillus psittaci DSM 15354]